MQINLIIKKDILLNKNSFLKKKINFIYLFNLLKLKLLIY